LFANRAAKTQRVITAMPGRSFGVGLVNFVFFGTVALVLFSLAENAGSVVKVILTLPAIVIAAILAIMLSFGLAGIVNLLGERILPEVSTWKRTVFSTAVLSWDSSNAKIIKSKNSFFHNKGRAPARLFLFLCVLRG
jgi:hypothetical protein